MRILALTLSDGSVRILEAPAPVVGPGCVRVRTLYSAISPGTEGNKVVTGQKSLLAKAKARPEQVRQVIEMARSIGLKGTIQKVRSKLESAAPLGYSLAGEVTELGPGVTRFSVGDIVACAGGGYANHADETVVPENLVVPIPAGVPPQDAALATLGSIALQGARIAEPTLGESAVVVGLGVIGMLAGQLLRADGCRVFGVDISADAVALARRAGCLDRGGVLVADPVESMISEFTRGRGADMVLICAAASSNDPIELAGRIARRRARVVVVGAVGMAVPREDYYRKEIALTISCSYGPGRYDPTYEEQGLDYPVEYVRWTEGRNIEAVLDMMAAGKVRPADLISHRFSFEDAPRAYRLIAERSEPFAGILLEYPTRAAPRRQVVPLASAGRSVTAGRIGVGCVGAGSYAQAFLLPPLKGRRKVAFTSIHTRTGLSAADVGRRFGFARAVDSVEAVVNDPETQAVIIATRHDQHASAALAALRAGKHVFVEKPLCLTHEELRAIASVARGLTAAGSMPVLQVGYNRRFSPAADVVKRHFGSHPGPLAMLYRVSAGIIPREHWIQDEREGGGRILGEVCHFVDLLQHLAGADAVEVSAACLGSQDSAVPPEDDVLIELRFANGSIGTIGYFARGAKSVPKERIEVHGAGRSAVIDNFSRVELFAGGRRTRRACAGKGQAEEIAAFVAGIREGRAPIPLTSLLATSLATLGALQSLRDGSRVRIDPGAFPGPS